MDRVATSDQLDNDAAVLDERAQFGGIDQCPSSGLRPPSPRRGEGTLSADASLSPGLSGEKVAEGRMRGRFGTPRAADLSSVS